MVMASVKRAMFAAARHGGLNAVLRRRMRRRLLVLCYHGVVSQKHPSDAYRYRNTVSLADFGRQLDLLRRWFRPISIAELIDWIDGRADLPPYPALVTFDDGFRNNLDLAAPELERRGVPAVFAVATGYIGTTRVLWPQELNERVLRWPNDAFPMPDGEPDRIIPADPKGRADFADLVRSRCKRLSDVQRVAYLDRLRGQWRGGGDEWDRELFAFLDWDGVRSLHRRGFSIGSHTCEHPILSRLSPEALDRELTQSKATIERELAVTCDWIAYPNGGPDDVTSNVRSRVKHAGYKAGFMLTGRRDNLAGADPFDLDRLNVGHDSIDVFQSCLSGLATLMNRFR